MSKHPFAPAVALRYFVARLLALALLALAPTHHALAQTPTNLLPGGEAAAATSGPVRLRQPATSPLGLPSAASERDNAAPPPPRKPSEFEYYVSRLVAPETITRYGAELVTGAPDAQDFNPLVPPEYLLQPGDEVQITLWGSVDADLRLVVDRSGRISVPRVGTIMVAGVRYADLPDLLNRRVSQVFRNFQLSVGLGQLRGVRVYVTGFVSRPGSYTVSSLSTVTGVLMQAGGPSAAGGLRAIQLKRGRDVVATLDLYELLQKGDRSADRLVQPEDVIHVGPIGTQVALIGSVNRPAIFELKANETLADLLRMAGGFSAVANRSRVAVERLDERNTLRVTELVLPASMGARLDTGDVVRALSAVDLALPQQLRNKRVRVEGEVLRPGEYVLPADSTIAAALQAAGGLTPAAYVYGAEFTRPSVKVSQQANYDRALRDLETQLMRQSGTLRTSTADEAAAQGARVANAMRLIDRLRSLQPTGRVVLELKPADTQLPDLVLEDGDRLYVPPRLSTVGVFGSVFNAGSYLHTDGRLLDDYLRLAGGPTKGADAASAMVIRANGSVVSSRQQAGWFNRGPGLDGLRAEAGDTVFVPEEIDKTSFVQSAKDWTTIFYNFGLGAAAIKSIFN